RIQNELLCLKEYQQLIETIQQQIKDSIQTGQTRLMIAVGCEQGQHRSVAVVEHFDKRSRKTYSNIDKQHRDLSRLNQTKQKQKDRRGSREKKYNCHADE
ncbi:unnamed protein product, partial [Didymodactylos carnosus]